MTILSSLRSKSSSVKKGAAALFLAASLMSCGQEPLMKREDPYLKIPLSNDIKKVDYRDKIAEDPICDDFAKVVAGLKKRKLSWNPDVSQRFNNDARHLAVKYNDRNAPNVCRDVMSEKYGDLGPTNVRYVYAEPPPNGYYGPMPIGDLPTLFYVVSSWTMSYLLYKLFID